MISEKTFVLGHSGFWTALLPRTEAYVRSCNLALERFLEPVDSAVPAGQRGVVNEFAFRLFASAVDLGIGPEAVSAEVRRACATDALDHIRRMREFSRTPVAAITSLGEQEGETLALRLAFFFAAPDRQPIIPRPRFPGCGWLSEAEGDVLASDVLVEIKAGDRLFRGADFRQLLAYCALNFAAKRFRINHVCLMNPRRGVYFLAPLEGICEQLAGATADEVLGDIVAYVSEPVGRYRSG